jgi:tRNA1(Val) A37 N6-methylase TrmN6
MSELLQGLEQNRLTPKIMKFIHSYHDRPAKHVLVCARKDAAGGMEILPPHIVYKKHKEYTAETLNYYTWETDSEHKV